MDDKVSVLIIEDEGIVALGLEDTLQSEGYHVAGIADNGREALTIIKEKDIDLMLLDIQIKGEWDGIETARQLTALKDIPFIYLTAFSDGDTVERAKETVPAAYLIKPFQPRNLLITIELALHNFAYRKINPSNVIPLNASGKHSASDNRDVKDTILYFNDAVFIKQSYKFIKVRLDDIYYLEVEGNYTSIITKLSKYVLRLTLSAVLDRFHFMHFIRVHRSFAINMQHIDTFNETSIFINGREIPLSRHYKDEFIRHFDFL